ncbi:hypothetical protein HPB50_007761 [Hyalomma asiaticum]|uniref:Uncharacterized protein n=1 Tax=Hyalomma asiaticum TaxID=266040 RepID=A0ACB7SW85_HYAAI|nr:hypothetical protein HPB50_007761 [Hyalomma asiaticum]
MEWLASPARRPSRLGRGTGNGHGLTTPESPRYQGPAPPKQRRRDHRNGAGDRGQGSDQRKELLCCVFLFCCGLLACKYLIIEQYKISRRRQDAATTEHYKAQTPQPEVISPKLNQPPIVPFPMICVYSDTLLPSTPLPKDGLCDYTFFDSFYKDGTNKIDKDAVTSVSLATYLDVSVKSTYAKTQMGIGFSQYGASEAVRVINTDEGDDFMLELWKGKKLRHYGVLDVDARTANVNDILRLLQALRYQQQLSLAEVKSSPKPTAYIVVGCVIGCNGHSMCSQFPVDLLIARTHLDMRDDHREDCRITGPTVYREPYSIYQLSMALRWWCASLPCAFSSVGHPGFQVDVVKFLHEKRYSFSSSSVAISVTMRARWYSPRDNDSHWYFDWSSFTYKYPYPGYEPGQPCTGLGNTEHFTSYFYVCTADYHFTERLRQISGDKQFMHTFSESSARVLTFDNDVTIRGKYCDLREILNGVAYGIAIFDADQDAWHKNPCDYGPKNFDRMNMVRKLMDHISKPGRDHFPEGCWTVT